MKNISIERFDSHPQGALGVIKYGGDGGEWYLLVDARGLPHVSVRAYIEDGKGGRDAVYIDADSMVDFDASAAGLFGTVFPFEEEITEEAAEQAAAEHRANMRKAYDAGCWARTGEPYTGKTHAGNIHVLELAE